ncbi:MAG TPA: ribosomal protein S18-alanine N-acetyltransferase [Candidatus Ruthenibacterium avium]|uniref:[Ribosomal protein bS18]-alanine N-acetyltransferase n=1 Tax=Candidatus Ruthenibacterium avium TaxID=2838751 RepID=A0A9D2RZR9_9FIRM|nr:ribosomal protein S18-alanine N-acetyltransferase [Candidatus Ruthenibacterium avium]
MQTQEKKNGRHVRRMTEHDIARVAAIESRVQDGWSAAGIESAFHAPCACCFVLCEGESVIGFAAFTAVADEANLDALSIDEAARRTGGASALLRDAFAELSQKGCKRVTLEVRVSNFPARGLYEMLGFTLLGIRKNFYSAPPENAFMMELLL